MFWEIVSNFDTSTDFATLSGSVSLVAGQRVAEVLLTLLPDDVPELEELYTVRLTAVEGGAELDTNRSFIHLRVQANDEPYGVFAIYSELQQVVVEVQRDRHDRHFALNVTRHKGTFGNVSVQYEVRYAVVGQTVAEDLGKVQGTVVVMEGQHSASTIVPIKPQVCVFFLKLKPNSKMFVISNKMSCQIRMPSFPYCINLISLKTEYTSSVETN